MRKSSWNVKTMARVAIITAMYVVLTFITYPVSYGELGIEFRISEILVLLCFFNSKYIISLTVGCFIANSFGSMGLIDSVFGSIATLLSCICISKSKNIFVSSIYPVFFNSIIVGVELYAILELPLIISMIGVGIGEFVVVTIIGCPLFYFLSKRKDFQELIGIKKI